MFNKFSYCFQEQLPSYPGPDGYSEGMVAMNGGGGGGDEPFQILEIRLMRQVSGFGFRIIGGREEGSQVKEGRLLLQTLQSGERKGPEGLKGREIGR